MIWTWIITIVIILILAGLRIVNHFEREVILTLGKYTGPINQD